MHDEDFWTDDFMGHGEVMLDSLPMDQQTERVVDLKDETSADKCLGQIFLDLHLMSKKVKLNSALKPAGAGLFNWKKKTASSQDLSSQVAANTDCCKKEIQANF